MRRYNAMLDAAMIGNYRRMYQAKYGEESSLSHEEIFKIADEHIMSTGEETGEVVLEVMHEQQQDDGGK